MTVELYNPDDENPKEPTLGESWDYFKKGLTSPEQWQEVVRAAKSLRENIPGVAETWTRGTIAPIFGGVGDINELGNTVRNKLIDLLPENVAKTVRNIDAAQRFYGAPAVNIATKNAPTTEKVLESVPRITPEHEGAKTMENVAGFVSPGTGYVAGKLASLTKGMPVGNMFIGPGSKSWDDLMQIEARRLELEGKTPKEIYKQTGSFRGLEGKWKQEIPDLWASLRDHKIGGTSQNFGELFNNAKNKFAHEQSYVSLDDILQHDELKKAYPNIFKKEGGDIEIRLMPENTPINEKGSYIHKDGVIKINPNLSLDEAKSTILHEIQHNIQSKEGFALGGSHKSYTDQNLAVASRDALTIRDYWNKLPADMPNWKKTATIQNYFKDIGYKPHEQAFTFALSDNIESRKLADMAKLYGSDKELTPWSPEKMYKHISGEAESRLTQTRQSLDEQSRRNIFPMEMTKWGLDIEPKNAIVHGTESGNIYKGGEIVRRKGDYPEKPDTGVATSTNYFENTRAFKTAQKNAAKPIEEGGLGLPKNNTAADRAKAMGFNTDYFHGTERLDRLTEGGINPKRATSGPMPFGTDNPIVASNYSTSKKDTSRIAQDVGDMSNYFQVSPKDMGMKGKNPISVEKSWYFLPQEKKAEILDKARRIGYENPEEGVGKFVVHKNPGKTPFDESHFDYTLKRESNGNPLTALRKLYAESGILDAYEPKELSDIYKAVGYPYEISQSNAPWSSAKGVLLGKARIQNPLTTNNVDELKSKVIPQLEEAFKTDKTRKKPYGADQWDKNVRFTPKEWVEELKKDVEKGENSYVWTSIPDKVTAELKKLGYDGILDVGGKGGGVGHEVVIPFGPEQVRSKFAAFDPAKINKSGLLNATVPISLGTSEYFERKDKK